MFLHTVVGQMHDYVEHQKGRWYIEDRQVDLSHQSPAVSTFWTLWKSHRLSNMEKSLEGISYNKILDIGIYK